MPPPPTAVRRPTRAEGLALALLCAYVALASLPLRGWWVEDAAITFSYARNLAHGDGIVAFPGAERTEGYSNPLWMALLALGQLADLSPFLLSKVLGVLLAAACIPLTWAITAQIVRPEDRASRLAPLLAAALVATNAQHIIWANAGLENALLSCLLALGIWRVGAEVERGGPPWSALAFLGVALTHSEGPLYGAAAFVVAGGFDLLRGRRRRVLIWAACFGLPLLIYQACRTAYFGLVFPLPYYAKLSKHSLSLFKWHTRSWKYLANWSVNAGGISLLPLLLFGVTRARGWRGAVAGAWLAALGALAAAAAIAPDLGGINPLRIVLLIGLGAALPALALHRQEGPARILCAGFVVLTVAFTVLTGGDWMAGFRRFSALAVPASALAAAGAVELSARLLPRFRGILSGLMVLTPILWSSYHLSSYYSHPLRMTPLSTRTRVRAFNEMAQRIQLDRRWTAVDHAMGGQMWFGARTGRAIDWYGLTEPTFALHHPLSAFALDYLLDPPRFDFAHLERGISITKQRRYREAFVRVPRVPGKNDDNWLQRALITAPSWPGRPRAITFASGQRVVGLRLRSPEVSRAGGLYVELGLQLGTAEPADFSMQVILSGPTRAVMEVSPGYEGLLPPASWRADEVFMGRYALALPAKLPAGRYAVSLAVDGDERALPDVIRVLPPAKAREYAEADWERAERAAADGDCEGADEAWTDALKHAPLDRRWAARLRQRAEVPLAGCWAASALLESALPEQVADLGRARRWDVRAPAALDAGAQIAEATWPLAMAAREAGDAQQALALFQSIVEADPRRSWARRYAEEARRVLIVERVGGEAY